MSIQLRCVLLFATLLLFISQGCQPESSSGTTQGTEDSDSTDIVINVPEGYELEELYVPSDHNMGTWVSLAEDDQGRMYAGDQHGHRQQHECDHQRTYQPGNQQTPPRITHHIE